MLPSRRLIILVAVAAPMFLAGAAYDAAHGLGVVYLVLLAAYAVADAIMLPRRARIRVEREVPGRISIGVGTRVAFTVRNGCRRPIDVELAEDLPATFTASPAQVESTLQPGAAASIEYRLTGTRRGAYRLSAVDVRVLPAMGLFHRQFRLELPAEVHVFPNLVNIKRYELLLRRGASFEQGIARLRQIGQGTEFESLRPYTAGDELSRIDWKVTSKHARLIVKNCQTERQQSVLAAIDVGRATAGEFEGISRLDYYVNATLMLAYVALRQGDWFSLLAFSDRIESYLPPVRHVKSIDRVARALYELQSKLVEADYSAACQFIARKNRRRGLICLMTDVIDRDASGVIIEHMTRFERYHLPLAVTLSNPEVIAVAEAPLASRPDPYGKAVALDVLEAREEALAAMRSRGVDVLDASPHAVMPELINRYLLIKSRHRL